ncbi:MAG: hypothetical protein GWN14_03400 [candidate division Zixibacteria bacterium]|nr:hypothetical protein [candidate division Zixibacteria bacterium]
MGAGIKRFIFYLLLASFLDACTHVGKKQILPNHHHYFKAGQHYTFAVYDTHNQLISHPFERWLEASKRALDDGKPYTDLYIISHGWNFTYQEAVSNFNRYMDIWDNKTNEGFRPYIIFILWNSTSRPITESITAIFPFGIDDSLSPVSDVSDTAIHLVTGWKQSLNAQHNALGKNFPIVYKYKNYSFEEINGETGLEGRDIPLSMILYEIIKANNKTLPIYIKAEIEEIPDFKSKKTYEPQRIHLIGHSYGAKLISLASLEALHRFFPDNTIDPSSPISRTSMLALRDLHPDKIKLPKSYSLALLESLNLNPGGNYKADHFIKRHTNTLQTQSLNPQSNTNESSRQKNNDFVESPNPPTTFESLVLMNAAFGPEELEYDYDLGHSIKPEKQFSLWNHIPRKALVYSNTDLATGLLFNTGQIVFNNRWGQFYSSVDKSTRSFLNNIYSL